MMKKPVLITITPNQPDAKPRSYLFLIVFIAIALLVVSSVFFVIRTYRINRGVLVKISDISALEKENRTLKAIRKELKEKLEKTKYASKEIEKSIKRVEPLLGIQDIDKVETFSFDSLPIPQRLDSLLVRDRKNTAMFSKIFKKIINNNELSSAIPSILPVDGWLVKGYGYIDDIFTDKRRFHPGFTFFAAKGSPVCATGAGTVIKTGMADGIGLFVEINHGFGYMTKYGHLQFAKVKQGDYVERGDIIGYVGKTGRVMGPSLYYEVTKNGVNENPEDFIFETIKTMKPETNE
ncbi:MAG: hypothetical protein B5M53_04065 [Candidatus Cloacimonas sp. 4484_209]|nr:MAG: hypothetical protein B5M53_04065 [Candidatus Cloacimonas sp. 4484_209]